MSETKRKRSYTIQDKLSALAKIKEFNGNIAKVSRELNIDRKCLREWRNNEEKIVNLPHKRKLRKIGCGRKPFFKELEDKLIWVKLERMDKRNIVNYRRMREKAHQIADELKIRDFIGSDKWLFNFCRRHELTIRKITHVGQEDNRTPEEKREIAIEHLARTEKITIEYNAEMIFNMDETPVYIDMLNSTTISFKGEKNVEANGTGHGKTRFSVVLAISASGKMLRTLVILKGLKNVPKCKVPPNIFLTVSKGGSMNEHLMKEWKSLLFMDQYDSHKKESVLLELNKLNTVVKFIPPKTTHYLQPLDVAVNSSFKAALKNEWQKWMCDGPKEFTSKGYRRRPNWDTILGLISSAISTIKRETIIKSFECYGIAAKGVRVDSEKLNSKLQSILMGVSVEDSDMNAIESDDEDECDEVLEVVDGDDLEDNICEDEIGMMKMMSSDDED